MSRAYPMTVLTPNGVIDGPKTPEEKTAYDAGRDGDPIVYPGGNPTDRCADFYVAGQAARKARELCLIHWR